MSRPETGAASKFDETVEIHMSLGVDTTQSDQLVRGTVPLPHGVGKTVRVVVFCQGENVAKAKEGAKRDYETALKQNPYWLRRLQTVHLLGGNPGDIGAGSAWWRACQSTYASQSVRCSKGWTRELGSDEGPNQA